MSLGNMLFIDKMVAKREKMIRDEIDKAISEERVIREQEIVSKLELSIAKISWEKKTIADAIEKLAIANKEAEFYREWLDEIRSEGVKL